MADLVRAHLALVADDGGNVRQSIDLLGRLHRGAGGDADSHSLGALGDLGSLGVVDQVQIVNDDCPGGSCIPEPDTTSVPSFQTSSSNSWMAPPGCGPPGPPPR